MFEQIKNAVMFFIGNFTILSAGFYICLSLLVLVYFTAARKFNCQWVFVLFASLFFYLANGGKTSLWIFVPFGITYVATLLLDKIKAESIHRKCLTFFVVAFNVLFLIFFKELNFFIFGYNRVAAILNLQILEPVYKKSPFGISYITLMLISYYLDVSWKTTEVQKNPFKFLACTLFFPITTSGPISRYSIIKDSFFALHTFDYERFCFGIQRIAWGFFKKMVIAEKIAVIVNNVYGNNDATGLVVLMGLLSFVFQMYFDFSGCMDIVLGISEVLDIKIPENFIQPFFSTSLSEVWRRWHMTLGFWVKDYIMYPILKSECMQSFSGFLRAKLGKKNRIAKMLPTWCAMFVVWFSVGFWHGGGWNYIFGSGLFFFFVIAGGQLLQPVFERLLNLFHVNVKANYWVWFQRARTVFLFAASISFDRAKSFRHAIAMWKRVFDDNVLSIFSSAFNQRHVLVSGLTYMDIFVLLFSIIIWITVEIIENKGFGITENNKISVRSIIAKKNIVVRWFLYLALVYMVLLFSASSPSQFIYFQF